jgi:hypothetical protein
MRGRNRLLSGFAVAAVAAVAYVTSAAVAAPGVCDRLCKEVTEAWNCSANSFYKYTASTCLYCPNSNNSECIDGSNATCTDSKTGIQYRPALNGTRLCNCNAGISTTEAKDVTNLLSPANTTVWNCGPVNPPPPGGGK